MRQICILFLLFIGYITTTTAQDDSIQSRIIIIGDAGQFIKGRHPVISGARNTIPFDKKTTVLYVGDNLYKEGLPDDVLPNYNQIKAPLDSQIIIAKGTDAKVYFIPGNHDWNNGGRTGYQAILRQQRYIDNYGEKNVKFYPEDGCPGPVEVNISPDIVLLIIDSQWWIHPYDKPGLESDCPYKTKGEVITQIDDILSKNSRKLVIFAMHHPLKSYGIHGGYFTLKQHIFPFTDAIKKLYIPLPVIGSVYPITRGVFGTAEDLAHPAYAQMITDINKVVQGRQNIIMVAGHEHTLQLIKDTSLYNIVSGSGSKSTRVSDSKKTFFVTEKHGFVTLEISVNKNVTSSFYTLDSNKIVKAYSKNLFNFSTLPTPENPQDTLREVEAAFKDSVIISASDKYKKASGFKKLFLGKNYRNEWNMPVKFKVFNIRKEKGGLKISSLGGGKQTKSLRLTDENGKEWTLRTIDKDPEKAIPQNLRGTLANDIVQDVISASHPYAPLVVPALAQSAGIIAAQPEFFFVPDDPAFGFYQKLFANTVCLLEDRDPTPDTTDTRSTAKVINKILEDNDHHIDQAEVLKARLLDIVIGDWDRHFDQWKWGTDDTGKGKLYYPVPRDRDQAFFNSDGLLVKYISQYQLRFLQGFKKKIPSIKWFNWEMRDFDRIFMNTLDKAAWRNTIDSFQRNLPDHVVEKAVKNLPPEIYSIDAKTITEKIKSRRDILMKEGLRYYDFISKIVTVFGSNEEEYFRVKKAGDGLEIIVYKKKGSEDSTTVMYKRVFDPKETDEIRIYGLNGEDFFKIDDDVKTNIRIRMIGGKGQDTFNIEGNKRNRVYDIAYEKTGIINSHRSKVRIARDPLVNEYKPSNYNYNSYLFPQLNIGFNAEDKLLVGIGFSRKTYGFKSSDPFATNQKLSSLVAVSNQAYQVRYQGTFNSVLANNDIVLNAELVNPTLNNFYGFGNSTINSADRKLEYYRVRYNYISGDVLLRKRFNEVVSMSVGPTYYHYWNDLSDNKGRILETPSLIGLDSANVYTKKAYVGGKARLDISYINNDFFPSRGIIWNTEFTQLFGVNGKSRNLSKITSDMTVYASLSEERKLMAVLRLGGGHIFTEDNEYFQALTLGVNNFNRGYRKNRFSGSSLLYGGAELRVKLFQSQYYILPGDVGLIGFFDVGRVWQNNEDSRKWHPSYGGGFYYAPFNLAIVSATVGISNEENLFNFSLGTKFNLIF